MSDFADYRIVKRANSWIEGQEKNKLTSLDKKLLLFGISEADIDENGKCYARFSFQQFFGTSKLSGANYRDIRNAHERLLGTNIIMEEDLDKGTRKNLKGINVFERVDISVQLKEAQKDEIEQDATNTVKFVFTDSIKPYIIYLKGNYTSYLYQSIQNFRSEFSISLYELLKRGHGKYPHRDFDVDQFRVKMGVENIKRYSAYGALKRDVIMKAISEINDKSLDMLVEFQEIKKIGKKVTRIRFIMSYKEEFDKTLEANYEMYDKQLQLPYKEESVMPKQAQPNVVEIEDSGDDILPAPPVSASVILKAFNELTAKGISEKEAFEILKGKYPSNNIKFAGEETAKSAPKNKKARQPDKANVLFRILRGGSINYAFDTADKIVANLKSRQKIEEFTKVVEKVLEKEEIKSKKAYLSRILKEEYGIVLK
ncbi:replication initiation protein [Limibacter armeniacum]|uniref:replication initiation protein n=1 Tax=Limibacter armeniacum TaxID=466084 RepID=UPI002FE61E23